MMRGFMHNPMKTMTSHLPGDPRMPMTMRVGHMFNKLMGEHYGDRQFDAFDFIPLVAVIVASALILAGLFPNGINTFGLTNGNLVIGKRREGR